MRPRKKSEPWKGPGPLLEAMDLHGVDLSKSGILVQADEYVTPEMIERELRIRSQISEGRTGGGLRCAYCGERFTERVGERLYQCHAEKCKGKPQNSLCYLVVDAIVGPHLVPWRTGVEIDRMRVADPRFMIRGHLAAPRRGAQDRPTDGRSIRTGMEAPTAIEHKPAPQPRGTSALSLVEVEES